MCIVSAQNLSYDWHWIKLLNAKGFSYFKHGYVSERMIMLFTELKTGQVERCAKNSPLASEAVAFCWSVERWTLHLPHVTLALPFHFPLRLQDHITFEVRSDNNIDLFQTELATLAVPAKGTPSFTAFLLGKVEHTGYLSHVHQALTFVLIREAHLGLRGLSFHPWR